MFFGILLVALNRHGTAIPIYVIRLTDLDVALENGSVCFHQLAEEIATGKYKID